MNEPITFFRKRQPDAGFTYTFDLRSTTRTYRIFVYSRQVVKEELVQSRKSVDYKQDMSRIRQAVGSGGVIALTFEKDQEREFLVAPVGEADARIRSYGILRPGSDLSMEEELGEDHWFTAPLGTHLLIPVDWESEKHLRNLKEYLAWLPPDLESLILYAIRKPSLDARIRDLEERSAKVASRPVLRHIQGNLIPILLVLIVLLNVGMLVLNGALFFRASQDTGDSAMDANEQANQAGETPGGEKPDPVRTTEYDQKIFEIVQIVQGRAESVPVFESLHAENFKGLAQKQDVAAALKNRTRTAMLGLGLMKLEALRLDKTKTPAELFMIANNPTALKSVFQQIGQEPLEEDAKARDLLAALGCQVNGIPGLPQTNRSGNVIPPHLFTQDQNCESFSLDKAEPGLEDLLNFVKNYFPS